MFDNKPQSQQQTPQHLQDKTTNISNNQGQDTPPKPIKNNTSSDSVIEPKDIFDKTDSLKEGGLEQSSTTPGVIKPSDSKKQPSLDGIKSADQNEPVIKSVPGMATSQIMPNTSSHDQSRKNLLIFIAITVITIGGAGAIGWWFYAKSKSKSVVTQNESTKDLFDQIDKINKDKKEDNIKHIADNKNKNEEIIEEKPLEKNSKDTDGDGLLDEEELMLGTSINAADTDNDGLFDKEEVKIYKTDPLKSDTDGDGYTDGDEIKNKKNPLVADNVYPKTENTYLNNDLKFQFEYSQNLKLGATSDVLIRFNDDINQTKLYVYVNNKDYGYLSPDISYIIDENSKGELTIVNSEGKPDETPYSTEYNTQEYRSDNGNFYLIKYIATKKSDKHKTTFEDLIKSFKFLK